MKKRIISLFLVIVMSVLALTGCAYNFSKKDMAKYTEDKDYLQLIKDALAEFDIKVTNEFTTTEEIRQQKVMDTILANLASKADKTVTKTEGKPGANDLIYFSYYITYTDKAEDGTETTYLLSTAKMKVLAASSMKYVQLGLKAPSADLDEKLIEAFANFEFTEDNKAYEHLTGADAKVENGTVVYVSYEREYDVVTDEGAVGKKTDIFVSHRVVLDENNPFHAELIKKHTKSDDNANPVKVGSSVSGTIEIKPETEKQPVYNDDGTPKLDENGEQVYENVVIDERADTVGKYSSIKIDFVEGGKEFTTITDTTYDTETKLDKSFYTDTGSVDKNKEEKQLDVKDKELTYHIYPAFYVEVDEYTAENIINKVLGESITESSLATLLFGKEYDDGTEDERKALLEKYTFVNGETELTLGELATALAAAQKDLTAKDKALKTAKDNYDKAVQAEADANKAFPETEKKVSEALESVSAKEKLYTDAVADRDAKKAAFDAANAAHTAEPTEDNKAALEAAKKAYEDADKLATDAKTALTQAIKSYNDAFKAYKEAYEKIKGNFKVEDVTDETAADAVKVITAVELKTVENKETVVRTEKVLVAPTSEGTLLTATKAAELTYKGNKSEAGKGGAVGSQLKSFDAREDLVESFFTTIGTTEEGGDIENGKKIFIEKYEFNTTYRSLEKSYNSEIENLVAKEVYEAILEVVKVTGVPKRAVKNTYNDMLDTYKVYFTKNLTFEGKENSNTDTSFYKQYGGSFQKYLTEHVMPGKYEQTGLSYKEALGYREGVAKSHVEEVVKIYAIAELLDVVVTDKEFKEYQESDEYMTQMFYAYYIYGISVSEDAARLAYQFDKIMEVLTESEKVTDEQTGATGISYEKNEYIGKYNPLTEDEWDAKYPEEETEDSDNK